jgi:hypothetical protein
MRDDRSVSDFRTLAWPVYLAGALMIGLPLADLLANIWPVRLAQLEWRFGTVGLLSGFTLSPVLGLIMCVAAAAVLEHRVVQRVFATIGMLGAVLLIGLTVIFAFDWLQYRAAAPAEARPGMDTGSIKAIIKHALVAGGVIWLAIASWRVGRPEHRVRHAQPPLVRDGKAKAKV